MAKKVVCMVRSGEAGRNVQEQAIEYVMREGLGLIFLHIIEPRRPSEENEAFAKAWQGEMIWLARVTLGLALRRAETNGLEAETVILYGDIFNTTASYLQENNISRLFIGSPHSNAADYDQRLARIRDFAEKINQATGAEVVIADQNGLPE